MDQITDYGAFSLDDLDDCVVDDTANGRFEVSRRIFEDPALFELEMEHIFGKTWVYLGHESQIPNPHDYHAARIGVQPVILTRAGDGQIHAFLNSCPHRGAELVGQTRGNQKTIMCPFHGWVFSSDGSCLDVRAHEKGAYPEAFDQQSHDLLALARTEVYGGFIFGSLNADVEDLKTHLGGATRIIDMLAEQSEEGMELLKGAIRYTSRANWKLQLENIDGYHFFPTHLSYIGLIQRRMDLGGADEVQAIDAREMAEMPGGNYDFGNGHMMDWAYMPNGDDRPLAFQRERIEQQFGEPTSRWMIDHVRNLMLYPNLLLMDQSSSTVRMVHPISVNETLVEVYCIAPKNEPAEARQRRIRQFEDFLGPAGLATPDDQALFEKCQRGLKGQKRGWLQGYARGMNRLVNGADDAAKEVDIRPLISGGDIDDETLIHGSYRQWVKLMRDGLSE
ncbi:MAG TPA: benzoate 1,2-dioxygenase large subunit [Gammaproteobacteria bacterium]|nr:benzoate 1,2-dioxygenase large subunit [Gammaproteobacteria bacterium]